MEKEQDTKKPAGTGLIAGDEPLVSISYKTPDRGLTGNTARAAGGGGIIYFHVGHENSNAAQEELKITLDKASKIALKAIDVAIRTKVGVLTGKEIKFLALADEELYNLSSDGIVYDFDDFAIVYSGASTADVARRHSFDANQPDEVRARHMRFIGAAAHYKGAVQMTMAGATPATSQTELEQELSQQLGKANELLSGFKSAVERDTADFESRSTKALEEVRALIDRAHGPEARS